MADTRQKVCSHRNLSVCVGKGDVGIFDGNPRAAQSVYLNHCYSSVVSNYRQWQRQEFLYRGPKNHGSLGGRGNPTPTTLTKSLDLHVYYKWHRSALWGEGVQVTGPPTPATAAYRCCVGGPDPPRGVATAIITITISRNI